MNLHLYKFPGDAKAPRICFGNHWPRERKLNGGEDLPQMVLVGSDLKAKALNRKKERSHGIYRVEGWRGKLISYPT